MLRRADTMSTLTAFATQTVQRVKLLFWLIQLRIVHHQNQLRKESGRKRLARILTVLNELWNLPTSNTLASKCKSLASWRDMKIWKRIHSLWSLLLMWCEEFQLWKIFRVWKCLHRLVKWEQSSTTTTTVLRPISKISAARERLCKKWQLSMKTTFSFEHSTAL